MIFEALSTAAMAGLAGYAYLRTKGMSSDTDKIQMIFKNAGHYKGNHKKSHKNHIFSVSI